MASNSLLIIFALYIAATVAQIPFYELTFLSDIDSKNGLGWPHTIHVVVAHDALLKLVKPVVNQESCVITTAAGVSFDINAPPHSRYESWGDDNCGVRIRNITAQDEGRWRMTSTRGDHSITGFSEILVEDASLDYATTPINLEDGQAQARVDLSVDGNRYCVVHQPFAASSLISGQCVVTLDKTTRAVQGSWGVDLGLLGRVPEYHVTRRVAVEAERLDVGYLHNTQPNKLHLYCNILNTHRNISFCRFQKTAGARGLNVVDGLSDGHYSYYGDGFLQKQCGLTVENPASDDFGSWRCSVGVQEWEDDHIVQRSPMQALITVRATTATASNRVSRISHRDKDLRKIFAQRDHEMTIGCQSDTRLSYCWFQSPNGEQHTPVALTEEGQAFWYSGESLTVGECGITFATALEAYNGQWTCHMGPDNQVGLEQTESLEVRITGALAANQKEIPVVLGGAATLHCHSSSGNRPLGYCRFVTPSSVGLNLDATVTQDLAILERYYFSPNRSLDHGDCSMTIEPVLEEDLGLWTCAALVHDELLEARDTIEVYVVDAVSPAPVDPEAEDERRARAGMIGMAVSIAALGIMLAGFTWYKYGPAVPAPRAILRWGRRRSEAPSQLPIPLDNLSRHSASSGSSSGSKTQYFPPSRVD